MPGYSPHPEFINYNEVIVEIDGYRISNVNRSGMPSDKCESHLQSFTINSAAYEADSTASLASTGKLSIIDYKYAVFNLLVDHWRKYNANALSSNIFPSITLSLNCFTGKRDWSGDITKWEMSFSGGAPKIDIEWGVYSTPNQKVKRPLDKRVYYTPEAMLDYIQNKSGLVATVDFVFMFRGRSYTNGEIAGKLKFKTSSVTLDASKFDSSLDILRGAYKFICENSNTVDGDRSLNFTMDEGNSFVCRSSDPNDNKEEAGNDTQPINNLVFVQNGRYAPYSTISCGAEDKSKSDRYVIPMTSLSFTTDFNKIPLQPVIVDNINGSTVVSNNGCSTTNNSVATKAKIEGDSAAANNSLINVSFECYNVACFSTNNTALQPVIKVFDEFGNEVSYLGGTATVTGVTYSLDGAVVKANVECTKVYGSNEVIIRETKNGKVDSSDNSSNNSDNGSKENNGQQKVSSDLKNYLCSEDRYPVPLSMDKTVDLLHSNDRKFFNHVKSFINTYGGLTGSDKLLDYSFVEQLISDGNFGLFTMLIAVGNYGIKNYPEKWDSEPDRYIDAISMYKGFKRFSASSTGKAPFDYAQGGLGIAHWDSPNLSYIYKTIGFDPSTDDLNHIGNLICSSGRVVNWVGIDTNKLRNSTYAYKGIDLSKFNGRNVPEFSKEAKFTKFDEGLRQDPVWKAWAKSILTYGKNDDPIFQYYLFELWVTKFWVPTISALKKVKSHQCSVQDAVRIARAGNSATSYIKALSGKSVEQQYIKYYGDADRYVRQKAFCRRCADIISWVSLFK